MRKTRGGACSGVAAMRGSVAGAMGGGITGPGAGFGRTSGLDGVCFERVAGGNSVSRAVTWPAGERTVSWAGKFGVNSSDSSAVRAQNHQRIAPRPATNFPRENAHITMRGAEYSSRAGADKAKGELPSLPTARILSTFFNFAGARETEAIAGSCCCCMQLRRAHDAFAQIDSLG